MKPTIDAISPEQLQAWKRLADEATSGPWQKGCLQEKFEVINQHGEFEATYHACGPALKDINGYDQVIKDAAFIAAARTAVPALIEEVERYRKVELFQEKWTGDNYAKQLEETAKIVEENDRLRKQLALCKEQRDRMCYNQLTDDERKLFFADKVLNKMDAEIEAIK